MDKFSGEPNFSDELIFGFTEEFTGESSWSSSSFSAVDFDDENEQDENSSTVEESKAFWESQEDLLMTTLFRTTAMESKLRQATKAVMTEMNSGGFRCLCEKMVGNIISCRNCMQNEICSRLQMAGHNCTIFKSKWRKTSEIPSGGHTYMEVVQNNSSSGRGGGVKIIIELNFRGQFEMARASEEYRRLIGKLPEVFVGKFGRLQNLVKILCAALKKSFKERRMHIAPWRKHKYMVAKWQGSPDTDEDDQFQIMTPNNQRSTRPIASMLTFALLDSLQVIPRSAMIQVL